MQLSFRKDRDLLVLGMASHEDLVKLASVMTIDTSDGRPRRSEQLTSDPKYKDAKEKGNLRDAWSSIAAELQAFGGDSFANAARRVVKGHNGIAYREILSDVCSHLKLQLKQDPDIVVMEDQLLSGLVLRRPDAISKQKLDDAIGKAAQDAGIPHVSKQHKSTADMVKHLLADARSNYLLATIVAAGTLQAQRNLTNVSIRAIASLLAPRVAAALTPVLPVAAVVSTLKLLSSPAYRVTLPAVLEVCRIRRMVLLDRFGEKNAA